MDILVFRQEPDLHPPRTIICKDVYLLSQDGKFTGVAGSCGIYLKCKLGAILRATRSPYFSSVCTVVSDKVEVPVMAEKMACPASLRSNSYVSEQLRLDTRGLQ